MSRCLRRCQFVLLYKCSRPCVGLSWTAGKKIWRFLSYKHTHTHSAATSRNGIWICVPAGVNPFRGQCTAVLLLRENVAWGDFVQKFTNKNRRILLNYKIQYQSSFITISGKQFGWKYIDSEILLQTLQKQRCTTWSEFSVKEYHVSRDFYGHPGRWLESGFLRCSQNRASSSTWLSSGLSHYPVAAVFWWDSNFHGAFESSATLQSVVENHFMLFYQLKK